MGNIDISKLQELKFFDVKDPFAWDYWQNISIDIPKAGVIHATIFFQNGPTQGSHDITATDIPDLNEKLIGFFEAMKFKSNVE
jgi:hypothetical protein